MKHNPKSSIRLPLDDTVADLLSSHQAIWLIELVSQRCSQYTMDTEAVWSYQMAKRWILGALHHAYGVKQMRTQLCTAINCSEPIATTRMRVSSTAISIWEWWWNAETLADLCWLLAKTKRNWYKKITEIVYAKCVELIYRQSQWLRNYKMIDVNERWHNGTHDNQQTSLRSNRSIIGFEYQYEST